MVAQDSNYASGAAYTGGSVAVPTYEPVLSGEIGLTQWSGPTGGVSASGWDAGCGDSDLAADALQFRLKKAIYDPDAQFDAVDAWHNFLAAATLGGFGKLAEPLGDAAN